MDADFNPLARRLRLGRDMRELREGCNLTLAQAAEQAGWSRGQISRIERGEGKPDTGMIMDLLELYKVEDVQYAALVALARQAARTGWWSRHSSASTVQRGLGELEAGAEALRIFQPVTVPGLLQTPDFAKTRIQAGQQFHSAPIDVTAVAELRLRRQEVLRDCNVHVVLDEAVLYRRLSTPQVRYDQMKHLIEHAQDKRVTLQVLPFDRHTDNEVAATSPFTIFEYAPPDPAMITVDMPIGGIHQESEDELVEHYQTLYGRLADAALSPKKSIAMMEALLNDI